MASYKEIGGGYSYALLNVGMVMRNPAGKEIFIQSIDDENAMRDNIDALDEVSENVEDDKRGVIADMVFGDYFA